MLRTRAFLAGSAALMLATPAASQADAAATDVDKFILSQLRSDGLTYAATAEADLNGDGRPETLAYISGPSWCGSGGCQLLIVSPVGKGYKLVTRTTVTQLPIRRLPTRSASWSDIAANIGGGGIIAGEPVALRFDGRRYPSNPTVDGRRIALGTGVVLIDKASPRRVIRRG